MQSSSHILLSKFGCSSLWNIKLSFPIVQLMAVARDRSYFESTSVVYNEEPENRVFKANPRNMSGPGAKYSMSLSEVKWQGNLNYYAQDKCWKGMLASCLKFEAKQLAKQLAAHVYGWNVLPRLFW